LKLIDGGWYGYIHNVSKKNDKVRYVLIVAVLDYLNETGWENS